MLYKLLLLLVVEEPLVFGGLGPSSSGTLPSSAERCTLDTMFPCNDSYKLVNGTNTKGYPVRVEIFLKGRELNKEFS